MATAAPLSICLLPITTEQLPADAYDVYLLNESGEALNINFSWSAQGHTPVKRTLLLAHGQVEQVHHMLLDTLNDRPSIALDCTLVEPKPTLKGSFSCSCKLKPKLILQPGTAIPLFAKPVHQQVLINKLPLASLSDTSFKQVPRRQAKATPTQISAAIMKKANLLPEIDLHAEALGLNPKTLDNGAILALQLRAFREWLDAVIRFGYDKVYVIHGDGKGVLKRHIHETLSTWPYVVDYNNNYHPRYGTGATEIHIE